MLGQFFTKNKSLQEKVYELILNKPTEILEPSVGRGDLVSYISTQLPKIKFDMYEIDDKISDFLIDKKRIIFGDFLIQKINKVYKTIVGNPPYVRTKKGNLYIDFIKRCCDLLDTDSELIFIIPSDFFKLTSARSLLSDMLIEGTFTHIYRPNNENLFEGATIDVVVFRYCNNPLLEKKVQYNDKIMYINNNDGFITFSDKHFSNVKTIENYFDVYVGFVTGKDEVFQNNILGNINVLWSENKVKKFILIDKFPCPNKDINDHLLKHKDALINRKIRKFNDKNWYEWGGLRNIKFIEQNKGKPCIYLRNMSRKDEIAFIGKVDYFGPGLFMLFAKSVMDLDTTVKYLNSKEFQQNFLYSDRFKIGNNQVSKSMMI
jgi:adenine-specific DNA-methyltransferase